MKNTAAFFDIDGTIYRDSLMVEHFKKLIKYEVVDEKAWVDNTRDIFMTWDRRQGNYDDYLLNLCDLYIYETNTITPSGYCLPEPVCFRTGSCR